MNEKERSNKIYTDFFAAGSKRGDNLRYGLEVEHLIVYADTNKAVPYAGDDGVASLLSSLEAVFPFEEYRENGHLLGLSNGEAVFSLEPGSQLELSVTASDDLWAMRAVYEKYLQAVGDILAGRGEKCINLGYQPVSLAKDIPLLPKARYAYMEERFRAGGQRGLQMMHGSASCQVALDYLDEADFVLKYRLACKLLPLLALYASNTPFFEGEANHNPLVRTAMWRGVDPARTGILPAVFDQDFSFSKYADYCLEQEAIFETGNGRSEKSSRRVYEVLAGQTEFGEDHLLYLSLVFPDVRLRQYIEIRIADSMPAERTFAYMALIKGLFSDTGRLSEWTQPFPASVDEIRKAQDALMRDGGEAIIFGKRAEDLQREMIALASSNLNARERELLASVEMK